MIARSFSQVSTLAIAAIVFCIMVTTPGVVDPEFAGTIYVVFALMVIILFGVLFFALRLATAGSTAFWSVRRGVNRQTRWIAIMIGVALSIQLSAGWVLERQGWLDETTTALGLLVWTLVPAAFLGSGRVEWPVRLRMASGARLIGVGCLALSCAVAVSYAKFVTGPADFEMPSTAALLTALVVIVVMAAAEEVVCRVLLLTALLDLTRSRFHAVFLSSIIFGLIHAPLALMQPVVHADWALLQFAVQDYAPTFLLQILAGLVLGAVWLRTGSIGLIALTHAIVNVGPSMLTEAWTA